ncbi:MAG: MBL fold metallo-hydrolase [Planctomycetes bacterium]|nr:MBL fold metallo-hydrolase [Planctomycetota bacterium]
MSDPVRLTVVGSGNASNAAGRGHSCYWLEGVLPDAGLMVDFGGTALAGIKSLGLDPQRLGVLAFTHLHGDHIGGYPFLVIDALYDRGRTTPLQVVGPVGVEERLESLLRVCYGSLAEKERPFRLSYHELSPGNAFALPGGGSIQASAADHQDPPEVPLCLRITAANGSAIAFSGDTRFCDGLFEAARGTRLLVAECSALEPPCGRHCSWLEWREQAASLDCPRILLTHLGEEVRARIPELLGEGLAGLEVEFADDGRTLEVR